MKPGLAKLQTTSHKIKKCSLQIFQRQWSVILTALAIIATAVNTYLFYPGFMSTDSLQQLRQALGVIPYYDWHPPMMALVWEVGIGITGKISSMLVGQLAVIWIALLLLSVYFYKVSNSRLISLLPLVLGLLPFVINMSGVIWKDVQMAFALLLAVSLSFWLGSIKGERLKGAAVFVIIASLIYAISLRYNAILAVLPIMYLVFSGFLSRKASFMAIGAVIAIVLVANLGINAILNVQGSNPTTSIMLDDIVHVAPSALIQESDFSSEFKDTLLSIQTVCAENEALVHVFLFCSTKPQREIVQYQYNDELKSFWIDSIVHHPGRYLSYRLNTFAFFLNTPKEYEYVSHNRIDPNEHGVIVNSNQSVRVLDNYIENFAAKYFGFLFRPYFWLIVAAVLLWQSRKLRFYKKAVVCLSVSSVVYILGYFPIVIGTDYRYIYWSVLATSLALLLVVLDKRRKHSAA